MLIALQHDHFQTRSSYHHKAPAVFFSLLLSIFAEKSFIISSLTFLADFSTDSEILLINQSYHSYHIFFANGLLYVISFFSSSSKLIAKDSDGVDLGLDSGVVDLGLDFPFTLRLGVDFFLV